MGKINYLDKGTEKGFFYRWVDMEGVEPWPQVAERATVEALSAALSDMEGVRVASVSLNDTGIVETPIAPGTPEEMKPLFTHYGVPPYYEIWIDHDTPGDLTEKVQIWAPVAWNERILAVTGGGNRTNNQWKFDATEDMRTMCMDDGVRNGFLTVNTDAANNQDDRLCDWGWDVDTKEINWDLFKNWRARSDHNALVIARRVAEAVYGVPAAYAYMFGTSGGGRQALCSAQYYPGDFDGIWSDGPVINYTKVSPGILWTPLVCEWEGNPLSPAKLEAFRQAAMASVGGPEVFHGLLDRIDYDARDAIGIETADGPITEKDAVVMNRIWEGPVDEEGQRLWYGFRPGTDFFSNPALGVLPEIDEEGRQKDELPFIQFISTGYLGGWVGLDAGFNWKDLTYERYVQLFKEGLTKFKDFDGSNPDLRGAKEAGTKMLLSHGTDDQCILVDGSFDYYGRVLDEMGGRDEVRTFFRFFPVPGDGHGFFSKNGAGMSVASGMTALMRWVEEDVAPDAIMGQHFDTATQSVTHVGPVAMY